MKVVAFETSSSTGSVALVDDGVVVGEATAQLHANHSDLLLPMLDRVLAGAGVELAEVDLFATGLGPGSFTGVRVGLATAKGLRIATSRPLVGVGSLDALTAAAVAAGASGLVAAITDGRRGELFATLTRVESGRRTTVLRPWVGRVEHVAAEIRAAAGPSATVFAAGDPAAAVWEQLRGCTAGALVVLSDVPSAPQARFVAFEALAGRGVTDDDDALEPIYLRPSDAKLPAVTQSTGRQG